MNARSLVVVLLGLSLPLVPRVLAAQELDSSIVEARLRALRSIATGKLVRVARRGLPTRVGAAVGMYNDQFVLLDGRATDSLPIASINSAWVRHTNIENGLLVGMGAGAFIGFFIAGEAQKRRAYAGKSDCSIMDMGSCVGAWAVGAGAGALVGAALGAVVGAVFPRWQRRFPL